MKRTESEIRAEIREVKAEMKLNGYRVTSFMNAGQSREQQRCNERLFALKTELLKAIDREDGGES